MKEPLEYSTKVGVWLAKDQINKQRQTPLSQPEKGGAGKQQERIMKVQVARGNMELKGKEASEEEAGMAMVTQTQGAQFRYWSNQKSSDSLTFMIWDNGGQRVFYSLNHLFYTKHGVYVLVFDCSLLLQTPAPPGNHLSLWLSSKNLYAPSAPVSHFSFS